MMSRVWDTIIIGAGLGGLTAAAKLVRSGKRVLVLDRNPHPGGTAYNYRRGQFVFPMGPLGISNIGIVSRIFADVTGGKGLKYQRVHYRFMAFGLDIPLSMPFRRMVDELTRFFPAESDRIHRFFQDVAETVSIVQPGSRTDDSMGSKAISGMSAAEYLQNINDWRLRRILGSIGTAEPYAGFALLASMWSLMCREGIWLPYGGLRRLCDELIEVVTCYGEPGGLGHGTVESKSSEANGIVKLRTDVKRIRVNKGKVAGVVLTDGSIIDSKSVISNADYKMTFLDLFDASDIPPELYSSVSRARQSGSVLQVCLGVKRRRVDLSVFRDASRIIYRRSDGTLEQNDEIDWREPMIRPEAVARQELEISLLSQQDPNLSPPGGAVIVVRTGAPYSHFVNFRLGRCQRTSAYGEYKIQLARALLNETSRILPGLDRAISTMDVATPLTFRDQGGRSEGAVAGWSWKYEDSGDSVPRELILTPVEGMYMAGYQAFSMLSLGGVPTAMESGRRAAQAVLDHAGPVNKISIPGVS
jgi:all-trans-retinol 13,14-reductase